jgi:NTP pyrophosphatase (non-canonical NTP hydrolase)
MVELMDEFDFDDPMLTMEEYANEAMNYAIYPDALIYPMLGLQEEVGELSGKLKRYFRDNEYDVSMDNPMVEMSAELRLDMAREVGDALWYLTAIATDLGYSLDEIASLNLEKLEDRKRRGRIKGSGDYR